jgi:hypothetical protein
LFKRTLPEGIGIWFLNVGIAGALFPLTLSAVAKFMDEMD